MFVNTINISERPITEMSKTAQRNMSQKSIIWTVLFMCSCFLKSISIILPLFFISFFCKVMFYNTTRDSNDNSNFLF